MKSFKQTLGGLLLLVSCHASADQFNIQFSSLPAPAQPGILIIELVDGDGLEGSKAFIASSSSLAVTLEGAVSPAGTARYLIADDLMVSSISYLLPDVFSGLQFSVEAHLLDAPPDGFSDALVFSFLDTAGNPLFSTSDPRGSHAALVFSSSGFETYAPAGFEIVVTQQVPEPASLLILATGLVLMLACRRPLRRLALASCMLAAMPQAHAALQDVSAKVALTRYPLTFDRVNRLYSGMVTVTNRSSETIAAPMFLVIDGLPATASVNNATDVSPDGKPMVALPVPAGGLPPGQSVARFVIRFHNPANVKLAPRVRVLAGDDSPLPPDPGEAGKETLAGIDTNSNGIRDDVEIYIATHFNSSERLAKALGDFAAAGQRAMTATNRDQSFHAATMQSEAMECIEYVMPGSDAWKSVESAIVNTPARFNAWMAHAARLSGGVIPGRPMREWKTSCSFDPDTLRN